MEQRQQNYKQLLHYLHFKWDDDDDQLSKQFGWTNFFIQAREDTEKKAHGANFLAQLNGVVQTRRKKAME